MKPKILLFFSLFILFTSYTKGQQKQKITSGASSAAPVKQIIQQVPEKIYPDKLPGTVASDAVIVDADDIVGIVNGICIISKGTQQALINLDGSFVVPYSNLKFESSPFSTLISANDDNGGKVYNIKGEHFLGLKYREVGPFDSRNIASVKTKDYTSLRIDQQGNLIAKQTINSYDSRANRNAISQTQSKLFIFASDNLLGYCDAYGKVVIAPQFFNSSDFTDGMAAVAHKDQFGDVKWGYINETGKLVIPFTFTIQPGNFHEGLALVRPAQTADFNFAYIDKTGQIKFKVSNGQLFQPYHPVNEIGRGANILTGSYFNQGYSVWTYGDNDYRLIDANGKILELSEINKAPYLANRRLGWDGYNDKGIYFYDYKRGYYKNSHGMMDYNGNILIPPIFVKVTADYFSTYAIAEVSRPGGANDTRINTKGIVNKDGVFVLILKQKSLF